MSGTRWGEDDGGEWPNLEKLPPGPHQLPRDLVREHQRRRILLASLDVFAEHGFAATSVKDLIRAAHVSRATFYEAFSDKEDCFVTLHDEILSWLWEQVAQPVAEVAEWQAQVRVAVERAVRILAEDPRLAVVCAIEAPAGAPRVREHHARLVERLCEGLRAGRAESPHGEELPGILEPALVFGAVHLIGRSIVYEQGPDPAALTTELPELILFPYRA